MLDTLLCWSGLSIQHFWVVWSFVYCCAGLLLARLTGKPMQAILSRLRHLGISMEGYGYSAKQLSVLCVLYGLGM